MFDLILYRNTPNILFPKPFNHYWPFKTLFVESGQEAKLSQRQEKVIFKSKTNLVYDLYIYIYHVSIDIYTYLNNQIITYTYIYHHHQGVSTAQIPLTLSRLPFLSSIALGKSSSVCKYNNIIYTCCCKQNNRFIRFCLRVQAWFRRQCIITTNPERTSSILQ